MAQLEQYAYAGIIDERDKGEDESYHDFWTRQNAQLVELIEAGLRSDTLKGFVWSYGVADGSAHYIVTKLRPLTLAYIDASDGYAVPDAHIRGLNKDDLQAAKNWELAWRNLPKVGA
jgi:hypothetical protein